MCCMLTHSMCHHELWLTSVSHPFSTLNNSLGFAGGKHYQEITIPILRIVLQNLAIPCCFLNILFYCYLLSLLSSGWFIIAICDWLYFNPWNWTKIRQSWLSLTWGSLRDTMSVTSNKVVFFGFCGCLCLSACACVSVHLLVCLCQYWACLLDDL